MSIYKSRYLATTIGILVAVVAVAFDQTAVTAIMPTIALALDGTAAYSLTFVLPMALGVIGMVAAGLVTDRMGARTSLIAGAGTLMVGLVLAMVAPTMTVFVLSRAIQGLGGGAIIVAIYAVIGLVYPAKLRPSVFAAFAGAYVLPSLIGPGLAGVTTQAVSWHGVFGLVAITLALALVLLSRALRTLPVITSSTSRSGRRALLASVAVATTIALMNFSSQVALVWGIPLLLAGIAGTLVAVRPLTPAGNRLIRTRLLVDMFFAAEIYLPLMLNQNYHLGPTLTGIGLTVAGLTWFLGSLSQSRFGSQIPTPVVVRGAVLVMATGTSMLTLAAFTEVHWAFAAGAWGISAAGMGFLYPRLSSETLEHAPEGDTGFIGSALQVMGTVGMTTMISVAGLLQTSGAQYFPTVKFTSIFATITLVAIPLLLLWPRASSSTTPK